MSTEYSGKLTLRVAKTLHKKLAENAIEEGLSLNQYCSYILAENVNLNPWSSKKFDITLNNIKNRVQPYDLDGLIDELRSVHERVDELRTFIKKDVESFGMRVSRVQEEELEMNYPVVGRSRYNENCPRVKVPSVKIVLEPIQKAGERIKTIEFYDFLKKYIEDQKAFFAYVNADELNGYEIYSMDTDTRSATIHILSDNLDEVYKISKDISSELDKVKERDSFKIKYYPTYILGRLYNEKNEI